MCPTLPEVLEEVRREVLEVAWGELPCFGEAALLRPLKAGGRLRTAARNESGLAKAWASPQEAGAVMALRRPGLIVGSL